MTNNVTEAQRRYLETHPFHGARRSGPTFAPASAEEYHAAKVAACAGRCPADAIYAYRAAQPGYCHYVEIGLPCDCPGKPHQDPLGAPPASETPSPSVIAAAPVPTPTASPTQSEVRFRELVAAGVGFVVMPGWDRWAN